MSTNPQMKSRRLSARTYLLGLIVAAVAPVWLFAAYLLVSFAMAQQDVYESQAIRLARQAASVVEAMIAETGVRLEGLAIVAEADRLDLADLETAAERLVARTGRSVIVRNSRGEMLLSVGQPAGAAVPFPSGGPGAPDSSAVVYQSGPDSPVSVAISRTVEMAGTPLVLTMSVPSTDFHDALAAAVPPGWIVGIADANDVYVTRSERHEEVSGKPGLRDYIAKAVGPAGTFKSANQFGQKLLAGYVRSGQTGWLYAANVELATVREPLLRSLTGIAGVGILALMISIGLAYVVGRYLTHQTNRLVDAARALGAGGEATPAETSLAEYEHIHDALAAAAATLRERTDQLRAVVETAPVAVWFTYDPSGRKVIRNRHAAELMGIADEGAHVGVTDEVIDTIALKDGQEVRRQDRPLTRAMRGDHTDDQEFVYVLPSGGRRNLLTSARPIRGPGGTITGAVQVSVDITDRKRIEEQQRLMTRELDHRVKNNLAVVLALAQQTLKSATGVAEAEEVLQARLMALAQAHDVLAHNSWKTASLRDSLEGSQIFQVNNAQFQLDGPEVELSSDHVMALSMSFHELMTNAVKYGALSRREGTIEVRWTVADDLSIEWLERGGPEVSQPSRTGFGSRLMRRMIGSLGGSFDAVYEPDGLRVRFRMPLERRA